jgi:parallel beta-helix repeat protein
VSNSAIAGGGVHVDYVTILSSTISYNQAADWNSIWKGPFDGSGGGVHATWNTEIISSVVAHNSAANLGGGWFNLGAGHAITGALIAHNSAGVEGGGVWSQDVRIYRSTVRDNTAPKGGGLAIFGSRVDESTISNNTASEGGGGLYISGWGSETHVSNSTISGNSAQHGGAINNTIFSTRGDYEEFGARLTMTNTTIAGNQASVEGAGFYYLQRGNTFRGWLKLVNTLIADNDGANCAGDVADITSLGHNLSDDVSCSSFTEAGEQVNVADARLGPLGGYGGPTLTHALLSGSPAIDAGDGSACPAADQRGFPRPQGAGCDIGAVEGALDTPFLSLNTTQLNFNAAPGSNPPAQQTIQVDPGSAVAAWSAAADVQWLSVSPASGSGPGAIAVTVNAAGLAPGTYTGRITVTALGVAGSPRQVTITLVVTDEVQRSLYLPLVQRFEMPPLPTLINGDLSQGPNVGWTVAGGRIIYPIDAAPIPVRQNAGSSYIAWLGGSPNAFTRLSQEVTIPPGYPAVKLKMRSYTASAESECGNDTAEIWVYEEHMPEPDVVWSSPLCESTKTNAWTENMVDLGDRSGKKILITFAGSTNATLNSNWFLSRMELCDASAAGC